MDLTIIIFFAWKLSDKILERIISEDQIKIYICLSNIIIMHIVNIFFPLFQKLKTSIYIPELIFIENLTGSSTNYKIDTSLRQLWNYKAAKSFFSKCNFVRNNLLASPNEFGKILLKSKLFISAQLFNFRYLKYRIASEKYAVSEKSNHWECWSSVGTDSTCP